VHIPAQEASHVEIHSDFRVPWFQQERSSIVTDTEERDHNLEFGAGVLVGGSPSKPSRRPGM
jgi:hypothetical protein